MSDTTGKETPSGNPTFSGPDEYASTTMFVKSLNTKSYQPTASIAQVQGGLTPGSFATKVMGAKPTMKSPLFQPVGSEVKRPKIDPETQRLSELGKLAEKYGITFTTDAEGNMALEIPPDFMDTEPDQDNASEQRATFLQEMIPLAVEYGELRKEMEDGLPNISDPSAKTVVQTLIEECDKLIKLEDPTKEQVEQLKTNLRDLKGKRHFIVHPKAEPVAENEAAVAPTTTEPSPEPATIDSKESVPAVSASPEAEDADDPFSEENVRKEMEKTKIGEGRVVAALEKDGEGNDVVVRYEIQGYNAVSKKIKLRNMQTGETKEEFSGKIKRALAEQEIDHRLKKEAKRKEKEVQVKTSAPEKILPEKTEAAEKETAPEERGEKRKEDSRRFEIGDKVRLMDDSGEIADWKIKEISRRGQKLLAVVERGGKTRTLKVQMLRKLAEETKSYEDEQRAKKSFNDTTQEKEIGISHPPISQFFAALNNPQHASKQLLGWYRAWIESGKIDDYRKEHANVKVPDALISFAKSTFPVYAEVVGTKGLSLETRDSARTSLIFYVRYLTGVLEEEDKNKEVIEYNIKNTVIPEGNVMEMKRVLGEAKLKETQEQAATKTILRPAGAFKVGQTLNLRGRGNIKVTKENVDDLNREFEEKKLGQTRVAAHEKELADAETQKMYQDAFKLDRAAFLSLYLDERKTKQTGETFYTRSERLLKHPYRAFIEKVLSENGVAMHDRLLPEEKLLDEKTATDVKTAQEYGDFRSGRGGSLVGNRLVYTPPLDKKHSPQIDTTQENADERGQYRVFPAKPRPTDLNQEEKEAYVESLKDKTENETQKIEKSLRKTEIDQAHSDMESMAGVGAPPKEAEAAPSKKSKGVQGVLSLFEKQRGSNWKAWIVAIGLGTALGTASAKPPAERILDSSVTQTAPQGMPWKELFLEANKDKEQAEIFLGDIAVLQTEAIMRKYAPSHFGGHNDPTKMKLALNWRIKDVLRDNTGEHFGHLSDKERMEFSILGDRLQNISISIQGHPLQSETYREGIKEAKQLISSRT